LKMRRLIISLLTACLFLGLAGCSAEGGDPTEAVPTGVFQVAYITSVAGLWDGAESLVKELRGVAPNLADEAVKRIEDLVRDVFDAENPPVDSLQGLWDLGIDVDKPLCIAMGGFPEPQSVFLVSIHDPDAFSDFFYKTMGVDKPETVEKYADAEIRLSNGLYTTQIGGLFIASESMPLVKSCMDALGDPEKRFFNSESVLPLIERYQDATACVLIDMSSVRGFLTMALTQAPQIPAVVKEWLNKVQSVGLGLEVQPEGLRFSAVAYGDFAGVEEPETKLPVPRDCLAFIGGDQGQVPLEEKEGIAGMLVGLLSQFPESAGFIAAVGEENLVSLIQSVGGGSFLFLTDAGWMPGVTFGLKLDDPALFKLIYDEKLRPLLASVLEGEMGGASLERRTEGDVVLDELTLGGPIALPFKPALAFYDGYLVVTTDSGMVAKIRDVDLGRGEGVYTNEDYKLVEGQLPGYRVIGFISADKLIKLLSMTPGLELPEAVQILGDHYALVSMGAALDKGVAEAVLLVSTRTYSPDGAVPRTEIDRGMPWWLWLVIGLGAAIIIVLVVVLVSRKKREA
ncbi:MAG: hypothetical protein NTW26_07105, partial [bacterium]|nr:hypothetical protein [bacterium]